jgi:pyridoxal phosphate enzyme (YggS family)
MSSVPGESTSEDKAMLVDNAEHAQSIVQNLRSIEARITEVANASGRDATAIQLVAVGKTKPNEDLMAIYDAGHRVFGENYYQELCQKAASMPQDIKWRFIGHLQSGKANGLIRSVPNLDTLETVDSLKLAVKINNACENAERESLNIYVQVDTSNEDTKSGIPPSEVNTLVSDIIAKCPRLTVTGLMTIGAPGDATCFDRLVKCRDELAVHLDVSADSLALSMGMSGDFEDAISKGATSVRVGSTIFGARDYSQKK